MAGGAVPVAQGFPDLSQLGWIPTRYSTKVIKWFYALCVLTTISQTLYQGGI